MAQHLGTQVAAVLNLSIPPLKETLQRPTKPPNRLYVVLLQNPKMLILLIRKLPKRDWECAKHSLGAISIRGNLGEK